jgi:hypothetical protein
MIFQRSMRLNDSSKNEGDRKNSVIFTGLILGPNTTDEICRKTMVMGTMHQGSTVLG